MGADEQVVEERERERVRDSKSPQEIINETSTRPRAVEVSDAESPAC